VAQRAERLRAAALDYNNEEVGQRGLCSWLRPCSCFLEQSVGRRSVAAPQERGPPLGSMLPASALRMCHGRHPSHPPLCWPHAAPQVVIELVASAEEAMAAGEAAGGAGACNMRIPPLLLPPPPHTLLPPYTPPPSMLGWRTCMPLSLPPFLQSARASGRARGGPPSRSARATRCSSCASTCCSAWTCTRATRSSSSGAHGAGL
jgi:hypothetical protein